MHTGDYTLRGYESVLTIERKGGIAEFARNIHEERFERELERMAQFKYAYVILEFTMRDVLSYPVGSGIPRNKWKFLRFRGPYILKRITEIMVKYPSIQLLFCGDAGKEVAASIFKRIIEDTNVDIDHHTT